MKFAKYSILLILMLSTLAYGVSASLPVSLVSSNTVFDSGQSITLTATVSNTLTGPYTYNFTIANAANPGIIIGNYLVTNSATSNSFTITIVTSNLPLSSQRTLQYGELEANVVVTALNTLYASPNVLLYHYHVPQIIISSSNTILDSGQTFTLTLTNIAGGSGPFSSQIYNLTGSKTLGSNIIVPVGASNEVSYTIYSTTPSNVFVFSVNSYDEGTTTPFPFEFSHPYNNTNIPGNQPGVAISPSGNQVYMTEDGNAYVTLDRPLYYVNYVSNSLLHDVKGVAFSPSGGLAYMTDYAANDIAVINAATNDVITTIAVGNAPLGVAFDPTKGFAYVTNTGSNTVSVINVSTNTVLNNINVGINPSNVSFSTNGTFAYIVNTNSNTVSVINTANSAVTNTIAVGCDPADIAINPVYNTAYVTSGLCGSSPGINVINLNNDTIVNTIIPGGKPVSVIFSTSGLLAYAGNVITNPPTLSGSIDVINVPDNSLITSVTLPGTTSGTSPIYGLAANPTENLIAAADCINGFACSLDAPVAVMVNPALSIPAISTSTSAIDTGQSATITSSWAGGTAPYTVTWYTGPAGNSCLQDSSNILATYSSLTSASNSMYVTPVTSNSYCISVTDSASTPVTQLSVNTVVSVSSPLSNPTITPSNQQITQGDHVTFEVSWSGGTPTYSVSLYSSPNSTCNQQSALVQQQIGIATNHTVLSPVKPTSDTYYCVFVADNAIDSYSINNIIPHPGFSNPQGVAISPGGSFAYITNQFGNNVKVINIATNSIVQTISSTLFSSGSYASHPGGVAFSPNGAYAYVSNHAGNVVIINTSSNSVTGDIPFGFNNPIGIAFYPDGAYAYIANSGSSNIVIVNTSTNTITSSINMGISSPTGIALSPDGKYLYVANSGTTNVIIINTTTDSVAGSITFGIGNPYGIAINPSGMYAYLANTGIPGNLVVINLVTDQVAGTITSYIDNPRGIAFYPTGSFAYVANLDSTDTSPAQNVTAINQEQEVKGASTEIMIKPTGSQISNPYAGGSTGFFGHLPGATTVSTSTTTTTVSSTVPANMTALVIRSLEPKVSNVCNDTAGYYINYPLLNATFHIKSAISGCFSIMAENYTSKYRAINKSVIKAINYTISNNNLSVNVTTSYPDNIQESDIIPAILNHSVFVMINQFTINNTAHNITFAVPDNSVIALLNTTHSNYTENVSIPTTSANTTVPQTNVQPHSDQDLEWAAIIVIVIIVILFIASRLMKK